MPIINIVCSGTLNQTVDIENLSQTPGLEIIYNPKKYHGAYLVIEGRKITVYKSGKYIITGLKHIEDVPHFFELLRIALTGVLDVSLIDPPIIQNIVITESLEHPVNLLYLIQNNPDLICEYEPEQFPGLIIKKPEGTILLFSTGKMVLTGLKSVENGEKLKAFVLGIV